MMGKGVLKSMKTNTTFKRVMITGLTAVMVLGGSSAVFADSKGKGKDQDKERENVKTQMKSSNNNIQLGNGNIQIILNFDDVKGADVDWASKNIASLAAKRVFEGYEDGTFRPRQDISRIEAITAAVRLMGLRAEAESQAEMSTHLNFKDADKIGSKYPWAIGYVAVAAEHDLFLETDDSVQPEKAADRLWATTLLVKALKLDAEAKAKMNTQLTFKDADKIPAGSVGYVAVAVEKGLVNGFENNTFRPNEPVSRAQLAALLDRTGDQMQDQGLLTGSISGIVNGNQISLVKDGKTTQVAVDPNAFIFRNGVKAAIADLKVNDEVKVRLYNNVAIFIEVTNTTNGQQEFTVDGTLNLVTLNAQGKISTISVNQAVYGGTQTAIYNAAPDVTIIGNAALLVPNQAVQLKGKNALVTSIQIK
jgi:hypothetical protein